MTKFKSPGGQVQGKRCERGRDRVMGHNLGRGTWSPGFRKERELTRPQKGRGYGQAGWAEGAWYTKYCGEKNQKSLAWPEQRVLWASPGRLPGSPRQRLFFRVILLPENLLNV